MTLFSSKFAKFYKNNFNLTWLSVSQRVSKQMDPEQRFLTLLKWWITNLTSQPKKGIYHAKPYNAVLGEVFRCKYYHEDSTTHFVAEQISHHPPVTCFTLVNREKNFEIRNDDN